MSAPEYDDDGYEEFDFEFELLNSEDGLIVTLVCACSRELTPDEYADALVAFSQRMRILGDFNEKTAVMN